MKAGRRQQITEQHAIEGATKAPALRRELQDRDGVLRPSGKVGTSDIWLER